MENPQALDPSANERKPLNKMLKSELIEEVLRLEAEKANAAVSNEALLVIARLWGILFTFRGKYREQLKKRQKHAKLRQDIDDALHSGAVYSYAYREILRELMAGDEGLYEIHAEAMRFGILEKVGGIVDGFVQGTAERAARENVSA